MAKETKSISVHPHKEQETINQYEAFGWEVQSSQEIFNRDSHLERSGNQISSVTTTTNYIKLVFSRETTMRNYDKLTKLEARFNSVKFPYRESAKLWFILAGIAGFLGLITLVTWFIGVPVLAGAITLLVFGFIKMKQFGDEYWEEYKVAEGKCRELLKEAREVKNEKAKEETAV